MKKLSCVAIDDEPLALQLLQGYINDHRSLELSGVFDDPIAAAAFMEQHPPDLLFTDIDMPDMSGLQLVQQLMPRPVVIFTTAHKQYALEGYELDAVDFLLKPFNAERFQKAVDKAIGLYQYNAMVQKEDCIYVRSEYKLVRINLAAIRYMEALQDYLKIVLDDEKPILTLMRMKAMEDMLPPQKFMRIHRSYLIPVSRITSFQQGKVVVDGKTFVVARSKLESLKHRLSGG